MLLSISAIYLIIAYGMQFTYRDQIHKMYDVFKAHHEKKPAKGFEGKSFDEFCGESGVHAVKNHYQLVCSILILVMPFAIVFRAVKGLLKGFVKLITGGKV